MPPVVNPAEVQTPANIRQSKPLFASVPATAATEKKAAVVSAPIGSIAALESALGF
ncbi:hypothetical protein [Ancylobacter amanitiformis]|uniref:Uncharacterized protein n=1 Tax=Ancylobacter amanitiformis TaxID=217069 RepID=A0ABU0LLS1_9HYPH|nr:hypothetical protein [Ancylobacter amanitiformis]MDQ0509652.1 hypothetical protein [Ancylobacter amanitiformis]